MSTLFKLEGGNEIEGEEGGKGDVKLGGENGEGELGVKWEGVKMGGMKLGGEESAINGMRWGVKGRGMNLRGRGKLEVEGRG